MVQEAKPSKRVCVLCGGPLTDERIAAASIHSGGAVCERCETAGRKQLEAEYPDKPLTFTEPERALLASYTARFRADKPLYKDVPGRVIVRLLVIEQTMALLGIPEDAPHAKAIRSVILGTGCGKCGATLSLPEVTAGGDLLCPECGALNKGQQPVKK